MFKQMYNLFTRIKRFIYISRSKCLSWNTWWNWSSEIYSSYSLKAKEQEESIERHVIEIRKEMGEKYWQNEEERK